MRNLSERRVVSQGNKQEGTKGKSLESNEPQAIIALVAAVHANSLPLDLILTDGEKNILLRFKGKELLQYSGLSRREVCPKGSWQAHCFEAPIMTLESMSRSCWLPLLTQIQRHIMVHRD